MRFTLTVGLLIAVLLAACSTATPNQPAAEGQAPTLVTVFKPPT